MVNIVFKSKILITFNHQVRYAESSMRNGFGLKLLHKFFNLPFLQLQRETLLKQLETNEEETRLTTQELDLFQDSDDADYNKFLDNLVNRRRALADSANNLVSNVVSSSISNHHLTSPNTNNTIGEVKRSVSMPGPIGGGTPIPVKNLDIKSSLSRKENSVSNTLDNLSTSIKTTSQIVTPPTSHNSTAKIDVTKSVELANDGEKRDPLNRSQSLMSKIFGYKKEDEIDGKLLNIKNLNLNTPLTSVEDFIPDDGMLDRSFLEDNNQASPQKMQQEVDSER